MLLGEACTQEGGGHSQAQRAGGEERRGDVCSGVKLVRGLAEAFGDDSGGDVLVRDPGAGGHPDTHQGRLGRGPLLLQAEDDPPHGLGGAQCCVGVGLMAISFALDGILLVVEDEADERDTVEALQVIQRCRRSV